MATTQEFYAGVYGNGFTYCLERVNVLDRGDGDPYDHWTTLSGYNSESALPVTDAQISESFKIAFNLHWLFYEMTFTADSEWVSFSASASMTELNVDGYAYETPISRVCSSKIYISDGEIGEGDNGGIIFDATEVGSVADIKVIRMYEGDITSEENFIGYGIKDSLSIYASVDNGNSVESYVYLRSLVAEEGTDSALPFGNLYDYDYVEVSGIHFVCEASITKDPSSVSPTYIVDAENLTSSADTGSGQTTYCEFTSLDFYTFS